MYLSKLSTPVVALALAVFAFGFSYGLLYWEPVGQCVALFYYPASLLALLCLPDKSLEVVTYQAFQVEAANWLFEFLQWFVIFLLIIGGYRYLLRKAHESS
jgi:predicted membrane channel-forming protein YqfA (hemolysin III family)